MGPANNSSNIVTIAATKNAALMTANEAAAFFAVKIQEIRGAAVPQCATAGINDETTVPVAAPCIAPIGVSGTRTIKRGGTSTAVQIIGVQALHPNNIPGAMINAPALASGTSAYAGLALGYIVRFTNGLTAYLTGDTGMFNDMGEVIGKLYRPNLVVMNIGPGGNGPTSLGHEDAATIIRNMLRPTTVMPTHVGEQATSGGALVANTRTEAFARSTRSYSAVVLPLSDVTLSFDRDGNCVGCGR
jgi:L-ascorbate metabolism protein UlaG (beta-lactamase superfamily)